MKIEVVNFEIEHFEVEELEYRLENRWCTSEIIDTCARDRGESNYTTYITEKC